MREFSLIREWAYDRDLISGRSNPNAQFLKLLEEVGELSRAIQKGNTTEFVDAIGDVVVVLTIMATQRNINIEDCIQLAYHEIKDRKGKMVNGVFVKEAA